MRHRYYADATPSYGEDNPEQIFERVVQEGSLYAIWAMPLYSVPAILVKNHANGERDVCSCQKPLTLPHKTKRVHKRASQETSLDQEKPHQAQAPLNRTDHPKAPHR